ncbi:MAG: hypothetical protein M1839_006315 [Geoglossum umbratile]|nr:MAG: hypothetical protein M1839_006315 [Geoglossum umbratile]
MPNPSPNTDPPTVVEDTLDCRYTIRRAVLEECLRKFFGKSAVFRIIEPDEGGKWKIEGPRRLGAAEKREIQQRFKHGDGGGSSSS